MTKPIVLVTGASGFIGYYICNQLVTDGYSIRALVRNNTYGIEKLKALGKSVELVQGDLNDVASLEVACEGADMIIHAAALVSFDRTNQKKIHKINVEGTTQLINIAIEQKINKFIYISSIAALGARDDETLLDESIKWDLKTKHSIYAESKHKAELEVWRGHAEGLDIGILSPSLVMGVWDHTHHSVKLFDTVRDGLPFYPTGSQGWVDVRDVAKAVSLMLEKNIVQERIILNGHNAEYKQVLQMAAEELGKKPPTISLNFRLTKWTVGVFALTMRLIGKKNEIQASLVQSLFSRRSYKNDKSVQVLNMTYRTLAESIRWSLGN